MGDGEQSNGREATKVGIQEHSGETKASIPGLTLDEEDAEWEPVVG